MLAVGNMYRTLLRATNPALVPVENAYFAWRASSGKDCFQETSNLVLERGVMVSRAKNN